MKFKIQAGGEIDLLTAKELRQGLDESHAEWTNEIKRGDRFRRFANYGDSDGTGAVAVGTFGPAIGPEQGFVWSVKRLAISQYDPTTSGQLLSLYVSSATSESAKVRDLAPYQEFNDNALVLYPGDGLVVTGVVAASKRAWMTGQVREIPVSLAWRL